MYEGKPKRWIVRALDSIIWSNPRVSGGKLKIDEKRNTGSIVRDDIRSDDIAGTIDKEETVRIDVQAGGLVITNV